MKFRHRCHEAQPEPAARRMTTLLEAMEPSQHSLALLRRDSRPVVGHSNTDAAFVEERPHGHATAGGTELDRIVHQVADGLEHEARIARHLGQRRSVSVERELHTPLLRNRCVKLNDISRDPSEVDALETGTARPILDLRNAQQRTEGPENGLRLGDGLINSLGVLLARGRTPARPFEPDRKSTRLNSSHPSISYAVFCLKKKN